MTYTPADFCQGHGGQCDAFDPEIGCLHPDGHDHGVVSYCDGSCPEAREHFYNHQRRELATVPAPSETTITLAASGNAVSYEVTFEGPQAEDRALAYISAHKALHFTEVFDRPFNGYRFDRLDEVLHPQCHHGMSLHLCMDPYGENHFGSREQEIAMGWA